jgi:BMFP domain-containing protein YqiC
VGEAAAERIEKLEARVRELEARLDNTSGDSSES